jgi:molybdenum cofactor biosynthesis enzyme MoaA
MRVQTFSILAGSEACNARCPFCVSRMTLAHGMTAREPEVNWRNFRKACRLAQLSGVTTAMLTGKGEPTLFPAQITRYLEVLSEFEFPLVEMQSNGLILADRKDEYTPHLQNWHRLGLSLIALSVVHYEPGPNRQVYVPYRKSYIDLPGLIAHLHAIGLSVRLTCVLVKGFIDDVDEVRSMVQFARENRVEHLTLTPVSKPSNPRDREHFTWTKAHQLPVNRVTKLRRYLDRNGTRLLELSHGAIVYDLDGQNVCLSNCLTVKAATPELRNLIFFPDGHLRFYWQYGGAILL